MEKAWSGQLHSGVAYRAGVTPHMQDHMEPHSEKFLMSGGAKHFVAAAEKLGFHAHRGIGQGDTMSTVAWIAVFDILLLHCSKFDPNANVLAYADDLLRISKCLRTFQQTTNKISSFCAITGQQISIPKVRAIVINPRPEIKLPQMHMRDANWVHSTIPILESPVLDYLGVQAPLMPTDRTELDWAITYLNTALCNLLARQANPECKLTVASRQILPKLLYRTAKASWPLVHNENWTRS